jgi:hypothetical protein
MPAAQKTRAYKKIPERFPLANSAEARLRVKGEFFRTRPGGASFVAAAPMHLVADAVAGP